MDRLADGRTSAISGAAASGGDRLPRRGVVLALGLLTLAGCGWRPLYERPTADPASGGVGSELSQISIDPVTTGTTPDPLSGSEQALYDSRAAQLLQNSLQNALNPYGRPSDALYHLEVELQQTAHTTA